MAERELQHELDKLKAARIYIAELIDKLDAAKFELAAVRTATLEEAAITIAAWPTHNYGTHDERLKVQRACLDIAAAIRALAPSGEGEER